MPDQHRPMTSVCTDAHGLRQGTFAKAVRDLQDNRVALCPPRSRALHIVVMTGPSKNPLPRVKWCRETASTGFLPTAPDVVIEPLEGKSA